MARLGSAGAAALVSLLAGSTAVFADVTPEQVWESWQKQYATYGFKVAPGSVDRSGDTLALRDVVFTSETSTGEAPDIFTSSTTMTAPEILLKDQGDGTVKASINGEISGTNATKGADGASDMAKIVLRKTDGTAIISGTPEAMSYAVDVPTAQIDIEATPAEPGSTPTIIAMTMTGLTGTQQVTEADGQTMQTDLRANGVKMHMTGADPEQSSTINADFAFSDIAIKGDSLMPKGADVSKMGEALSLGMRTNSDMSFGTMNFKMDSTTEKGPVTVTGATQSGQATIAFARESARYATATTATTVTVQTAQFPMPMTATIEKSESDFVVPLAASAEPQPFVGKIAMLGLSVSEQIWAMMDPTAKLSHGPANLVIDLTGTAKPLVDLFSPAAAASPMPPIEVSSLNVNAVQLTAAGAELTGNGALSFDNSKGMPMPLGAIDVKLSGANKLMDNLVAMGLMPQDQVMFAKMMMGMYAVPAGDDLLTSKIEFKEGGKILANGQPIQ